MRRRLAVAIGRGVVLLVAAASFALGGCLEQVSAAQRMVAAGEFGGALAEVEACLRDQPGHSGATLLRGNLLYLTGKDGEAIGVLEALVQREPKNWEARYALGRVYYFNARPDPARQQFEAIVAAQPEHYRAWDNLGLAREAEGKIAEAMQAHLQAIALVAKAHPEYDWAYANLAELLLKQDENRKAFDLAAEAAQRNPNGARNFYLAGKALTKLDQWAKAERWLVRAAELDPNYPAPHYILGQLYRRLEQPERAEAARKRFLELQAKYPDKRR